ncbi:hypothetical protein [Francisella philomiragia]|uniref:DUF2335 domain-containing protein n=1 Tax=Francisella philomiragia TaxID=28110 RepID=A0ABS1GDJ7_9GAMM|nr:hypothetical protein [Francisella philomiragia]MBK2258982.1 hypothetical protein [Francisella philomiragia]MBK2302673.1 hypothetical protein [Francisella philomiragia]
MSKLTKSQRKRASRSPTQGSPQSLTQNNYHFSSSEIAALNKLHENSPELADRILKLNERALDANDRIIQLEANEQEARKKETPYIRAYAFLGQFMAYSISVGSLLGAAYFGYTGNPWLGGMFLTSTVLVSAVQFFGKSKPK